MNWKPSHSIESALYQGKTRWIIAVKLTFSFFTKATNIRKYAKILATIIYFSFDFGHFRMKCQSYHLNRYGEITPFELLYRRQIIGVAIVKAHHSNWYCLKGWHFSIFKQIKFIDHKISQKKCPKLKYAARAPLYSTNWCQWCSKSICIRYKHSTWLL